MPKNSMSLAQFIVQRREKLNLTAQALSEIAGLDISELEAIEKGYEVFLPTTIRQKLALALKVDNKEIKKYERKIENKLASSETMDYIREQILMNSENPDFEIKCPLCGEKLITRIAKLYDLKDNLILRPKARCSKCPFQLLD